MAGAPEAGDVAETSWPESGISRGDHEGPFESCGFGAFDDGPDQVVGFETVDDKCGNAGARGGAERRRRLLGHLFALGPVVGEIAMALGGSGGVESEAARWVGCQFSNRSSTVLMNPNKAEVSVLWRFGWGESRRQSARDRRGPCHRGEQSRAWVGGVGRWTDLQEGVE